MGKRHFQTLLLISLSAGLYACQPDTPAQHSESAPVIPAPAPGQVPVTAQPVVVKQEPRVEVALSDAKERALAQKSGCFTCHMIEKKLVGPAWNEVAAKYRGQKDAEAKLIAKVAKGGSGAWGTAPMPPNSPRIGTSDIKALVRYILSLK